MAEPFIGEIRLFSFGYAPKGWAICDGRIMNIIENQTLYSLLGTTYGGDGRITFALPDLRGRTPVHAGNNIIPGEKQGEENHELVLDEMPAHTHQARGSSQAANSQAATDHVWANSGQNPYSGEANKTNAAPALASIGASHEHPNMQPFTVVNYCIALTGDYPQRN